MNRENVQAAINIMRRAERLHMPMWQVIGGHSEGYVRTEAELHRCGNTACFAGHVAVSPEFQASGGSVGWDGVPYIGLASGAAAIEDWLGVSGELANKLVYYREGFYPVPFAEVKPEHVIEKLELILSGELK